MENIKSRNVNNSTLAVQLFTLREFTKTPKDIESTFKRIKAMGYNAAQVSATGPIEARELKEIADGTGIEIVATHTAFNRFKNELKSIIDDHQLWGCEYVGLGSMPVEYRNADGYLRFAKEFEQIGRELQKEGLKFVYHNHRFEFERFGDKTGMEIMLDVTTPNNFGFLLDTYWVQAGGSDPADWIYKLDGRIDVIHFKDMQIIDDKQEMSEVLEGNLNWKAIFKACADTKVKWHAVEQDICRRDPFESLGISLNNLKKAGFR